MPKRTTLNKFDILRALVLITLIIYILGIVPQFTYGVKVLFANPIIKVIFLSLIIFVGYLDSTIGTLLAVAFLVSYLATPEYNSSPISGIGTGTGQLVGGIGTGTGQIVDGVGMGATELVHGVGNAAGEFIGGLQTGTQRFTSGLGSGTKHLLDGAGDFVGGTIDGVNQVIGGIGRGSRRLVSGTQAGASGLISSVQDGTQSAIQGLQTGAQHIVSPDMAEGMQNAPLSVSQAYQQHAATESGGACKVSPKMTTGCDPIVGYNTPYNCGGGDSDTCGGKCGGLDPDCLCKGVQVWKDEMNTQGLNYPSGYDGGQIGSTY